jgi:hypothetical protein
MPSLGRDQNANPETAAAVRRMSALHKRVALVEMTRHEFLDANFKQERSSFADGTTVTVDWDAKTVKIQPDVVDPAPN